VHEVNSDRDKRSFTDRIITGSATVLQAALLFYRHRASKEPSRIFGRGELPRPALVKVEPEPGTHR
jgi:hypothetical protein